VALCAVTLTVWDAGAAAPEIAVKLSADVLTVSPLVPAVTTFIVTLAVCVPEAVVNVIVPVQVVPADMPD